MAEQAFEEPGGLMVVNDSVVLSQADASWQAALFGLRTAARVGLPSAEARAHVARELASLAEWIRLETPAPATRVSQPQLVPGVRTILMRQDRRRRVFALQIHLDWSLWDELQRPAYLRLEVNAGQAILRGAHGVGLGRYLVETDQQGPHIRTMPEELAGWAPGAYVAEVVRGRIVIGTRLT